MFDTDELVINMGPQHPSTHGVLRVVLRLDGEKVVDCRRRHRLPAPRHREAEREPELDADHPADRSDGLRRGRDEQRRLLRDGREADAARVPRRARYVRTILAELQRIASHCLWLGTHAMDIGAMTVFLYAFRERELILDLFEEFCGARLTYNSMRIGGLPLDIPPGWDKKVLEFCTIMDEKVGEYEELLTHNRHLARADEGRRRDLGPEAVAIGLSGPALRGSGVPRDVRKDEPYAAYDEIRVRRADRHRRRHLRPVSGPLEEFRQSSAHHPPGGRGLARGPIVGKVPRVIKPPAGETYHAIESPKGELGYFIVSDGKIDQPVPLPRPAAVVLQPAGAAAAGQRPSGSRRRGAHRLDRHRARVKSTR